jgi:hypothetical protein
MRMTVEADVDGDEVLENMSIEDIADHLESRRKGGDMQALSLLLEQVYYEFARRGDAPKVLSDYIYAVLGRIL